MALMDRVQREDREWREARLHHAAHGTWNDRSECAVCHRIEQMESPFLRLTPWCKDRIGLQDYRLLESRARAMGVSVGAIYSLRHGYLATAERGGTRVQLRASGPLAAVLAGVMDDFEEAGDFTPDELAQIRRQSREDDPAFDDDPMPPDLNPEGDPSRNGAFG